MQYELDVANYRHINGDVLADFGRVKVHMNLLGIDGKGVRIARDSVIEAHAERNEQVCFFNGETGVRHAVHTGPAGG